MNVPGGNLLNMAFRAIAKQKFTYNKNTGRTLNDVGVDVAAFTSFCASGSIQPVARSMMQFMGLDMQRNYINVFLERKVIDVSRDVTGDQVIFQGATYQCLSRTPWYGIDGWDQVMAVQVS